MLKNIWGEEGRERGGTFLEKGSSPLALSCCGSQNFVARRCRFKILTAATPRVPCFRHRRRSRSSPLSKTSTKGLEFLKAVFCSAPDRICFKPLFIKFFVPLFSKKVGEVWSNAPRPSFALRANLPRFFVFSRQRREQKAPKRETPSRCSFFTAFYFSKRGPGKPKR